MRSIRLLITGVKNNKVTPITGIEYPTASNASIAYWSHRPTTW